MKRNNMNAFTLIELLAVIVILAIIALIATPIVLGIINDTKENAVLRSADNYLDAVEQAVMKKNMESGGSFNPSTCRVSIDASLDCDGEKLNLEIDGETPDIGKIIFEDGKITKVELTYEDKEIIIGENGSTVFLEREYEIGQEVTFNPGDMDRIWNVIGEDETTVTLLLNENLGDTVEWLSDAQYQAYDSTEITPMNNYGPVTALTYLNTLTKNWTINNMESYKYVNNKKGVVKLFGYREVEIENGITTITQFNSNKVTIEGETKARLMTLEEVLEVASKLNPNITEENLRTFIQNNLTGLNEYWGLEATTIDEFFAEMKTQVGMPKTTYENIYLIVFWYVGGEGIEHDVYFPEFMHGNLGGENGPWGHWLLSSYADDSLYAWYVDYLGLVLNYTVDYDSDYGLRPVITISKSQLS